MHLPFTHSFLTQLCTYCLINTYWESTIPGTRSPVRRINPKLPFFFFPTERKIQWETMLYIQLWIMNLNQFNNPTQGVFAFYSLSFIVAIEPTHFSITYIFIFQWVLKDFQGRARDRECSWRLPPPGNYVTPWLNSSWHFPHCTFCSSSKYIPLKTNVLIDCPGQSWKQLQLVMCRVKKKKKKRQQNVETRSEGPQSTKGLIWISRVLGFLCKPHSVKIEGFIFHF